MTVAIFGDFLLRFELVLTLVFLLTFAAAFVAMMPPGKMADNSN
jgi:hypothetical protein